MPKIYVETPRPQTPLPPHIMERASKQIRYIAHPLRLSILEFLDLNGPSCVCAIMDSVGGSQPIVSQSLKRMKKDHVIKGRRDGRFIIYEPAEAYGHSLLTCMRKRYHIDAGNVNWDNAPPQKLPADFINAVADKMKLVSHVERMRILEYLFIQGPAFVSDIVEGVKGEQIKVSQNLKRLKNAGLVSCERQGRFVVYDLAHDLPKTLLSCIHKRYNALEDKNSF